MRPGRAARQRPHGPGHFHEVVLLAGVAAVRAAVTPGRYERARIWHATFGIEQVASALLAGEPTRIMDTYVAATVGWLEGTCHP